jgi:hypothetical protein
LQVSGQSCIKPFMALLPYSLAGRFFPRLCLGN